MPEKMWNVESYIDGREYALEEIAESYTPSDQDIKDLTELNNSPLVRDRFFGGKTHDEKWNFGFLMNTRKAVGEGKPNFFIRDKEGKIVGTMGMKDPVSDGTAEIFMWIRDDTRGVMTNALAQFCEVAKDKGYKKLSGKVMSDNERSISLMLRAGFDEIEEIVTNEDGKEIVWRRFEKKLTDNEG